MLVSKGIVHVLESSFWKLLYMWKICFRNSYFRIHFIWLWEFVI